MMLFLRSLLFNVAFYLGTAAMMIAGLPTLARDRHAVFRLARLWGRYNVWLLRVVCGTRVEYRGLENIPTGGYIIAPKHQSVLETFALVQFPPDFSYILKQDLMRIPLFGWYLSGAEQIAIDRAQGGSALAQVVAKSRALLAQGRQVFIFPEGTRRPVGAEPRYKFGVAQIYAETGAPCLPVALNSGLFWPRRSFLRRPGVILVQFLEPIQPGLERGAFFALLQSRLEEATNALVAESIAADPSLRSAIHAETKTGEEPLRTRVDHDISS
ncbi:MAG TPA: lysophospholipid acyltransferase family protein [Beijerinckiaceae bacterium]|nr:lysophospholipid acyltransferase family protein [Beijerinckiaceae bacterium]HVB89084.1 lysophospholipid acyltransferase family protein [Beijerinckiaceae bacterium]